MTIKDLNPLIDYVDQIHKLRKEMNAVILSHYYQDEEIQDIADFIGDSLDLSRKASTTDADYIIFCGVKFMAEVALILNPTKTVLLPDLDAGCSLESSCTYDKFKAFKQAHPDHIILTYINSSVDVKSLSDIIVTSTNAEKIISKIPKDQPIIFAPDKHLGSYIAKKTGRELLLWDGTCLVHERFSEKELVKLKTRHVNAHIIAHPECPENLLNYSNFVGSTSGLINFVVNHPNDEFIIMTEPGIIHQMKKNAPNAIFYEVPGYNESGCIACNNCPYMKLNNIEKLYYCMKNKFPQIYLTSEQINLAKKPLIKMLELS